MSRILVSSGILLLSALVACTWWLLGEGSGGTGPLEWTQRPADPSPELAEEAVRESVVVEEQLESDPELQLAEDRARPLTPVAVREVTPSVPDDLASLDVDELQELERDLTHELAVSTVDELRWRFQHGLAELAGTGDDFDMARAWDHDRIMQMVSPGDGTHWRVSLPRDEFPAAYALWDRRAAVRSELELRRSRGERWRPHRDRTERERMARE